ncbi:MCE family protein [Pseudonocardia pini]|uniref:MCE family protein n=1 Tax=Pseudonocardia pini TaxID=2758030 RepID=UPI0015F0DB21|nr:MCE family protein [Pseudonocardia pini]
MKRVVGALVASSVLALSGCSWGGVNSFHLPGTQGSVSGSYSVDIQMEDVGNLVANNPVRLRDVNVGTITGIRLDDWNAVVTVSLNPDVELPRDTRAKIGQGSLLGAKFVQLDAPEASASPRLADGDVIPLAQTGRYPETEDVLASVAALLNGGGLQHIKTITGELDRALSDRTPQIRDLLTQLDTFVTGLDEQKGEIVRAIDGLDRMGAAFADQDPALREALDAVPPALEELEAQRADLVDTLDALGGFGAETDRVLGAAGDDLAQNLANLEPALKGLADAGPSMVDSLYLLGTVAFPLRTFDKYVRGDFINFSVTVDLTLGTLDHNFLTNTPFAGALGQVETILANGGTVTQAVDPLLPAPLPEENRLPAIPPLPGLSPADGRPAPNPAPDANTQAPDPIDPNAPSPGPLGGLLDPLTGGIR